MNLNVVVNDNANKTQFDVVASSECLDSVKKVKCKTGPSRKTNMVKSSKLRMITYPMSLLHSILSCTHAYMLYNF